MGVEDKRLTVGVTTRNRPNDLLRTILSLAPLRATIREVLVIDGGSEPPSEPGLRAALPADFPIPVSVVRFEPDPGFILSRNRIVELATTEYVLNLDDDIQMLSAGAVETGLQVIADDFKVAAIAFAQANPDGTSWPADAQASPAQKPAQVPAFIGFAHLLRREVFLRLGGYRDGFVYGAEEKEFCLRLLETGHKVVYLPEAPIVHFTSSVGRDSQRWLRMNTRNQLLADLMNMPALLVPAHLAWHTFLYFHLRRAYRVVDPWGWVWVFKEILRMAPKALRDRRPVRYRTFWLWRELRRRPRPYPSGSRSSNVRNDDSA